MELTFNEIKKRDVINICDGRCLGRVVNLKLKFPQGLMTGIFVPGKKRTIFSLFDKTEIFIESGKILKIGGDVILVDLKSNSTEKPTERLQSFPPPCPPGSNACPPPCDIQTQNCNTQQNAKRGISSSDFEKSFSGRCDDCDY